MKTVSKREMRFLKKYGDVAGAHIFRLLMLNMKNNRWPKQ
jgi:hypothetical protein